MLGFLCHTCGFENVGDLYNEHMEYVLESLKKSVESLSIQCPQRFIFHAALVHTGNTFFCKQSNVFDHLILQPRIDESVELEPPTHQSKKQ